MNKHKKNEIARKTVAILGVKIDSTQRTGLLKEVSRLLENRQQFFVVTPNPEILLKAQGDPEFLLALNSADISIPDGIGVLFAAKLEGTLLKSRIPGRIFMHDLLQLSDQLHLKVYFLGSSEAVIVKSIDVVNLKHPHIKIKGTAGPKLGQDGKPVNSSEESLQIKIIHEINAFKPDLLFIGFGAPKQEKWFFQNRSALSVGGAMVVGGSFDVLSGYKKTPPLFFDKMGIEWLWRVIQEPQRVVRIVNAVIVFPLIVFREKLRHSFR